MAVQSFSTINLARIDADMNGKGARICGLISDVRTRLDKRENTIAFVKVEQYQGSVEVIFWSDKYKQFAELIKPDTVVVVIGKCEVSGESIKITADDVLTLEQAEKKLVRGYVVCIRPDEHTDEQLKSLKQRCNTSDAQDQLSFVVMHPEGKRLYTTMSKIKYSQVTTKFLCSTFGDANVLVDAER
jgi:DNA polymerase-3 subunit alpha